MALLLLSRETIFGWDDSLLLLAPFLVENQLQKNPLWQTQEVLVLCSHFITQKQPLGKGTMDETAKIPLVKLSCLADALRKPVCQVSIPTLGSAGRKGGKVHFHQRREGDRGLLMNCYFGIEPTLCCFMFSSKAVAIYQRKD